MWQSCHFQLLYRPHSSQRRLPSTICPESGNRSSRSIMTNSLQQSSATSFSITLIALIAGLCSANYTLVDSFSGASFFDDFVFFNETDPSHGFVQYVTFPTAVDQTYVG